MANNPNLYNAALAGIAGGNLERWLSTNAADAALAAAVGNVAVAVDAAIAPIDGGGTAQQCQLMQSICQGIMSGRSVLGLVGSNYDAISDAIAAAWTAVQDALDPTGPDQWASQPSWSVNPVTGSDGNTGTPAAPLASVGELNRRLSNNRVNQNTTIQLVGNQSEALSLAGTQIADGVTVTIQGTVTTVDSGAIVSVTPLGGVGTIAPWQIETSGIDWSVETARRIQISNGANAGAVAWVLSVINSTTVIVGALGTLTSNTITPTTAMTFNVQTLSTIPASQFFIATGGQLPATFQSLIVRDLQLVSANGVGDFQFSGPRILLFGCQLDFLANTAISSTAVSLALRACKLASPGQYDIFSIGLITIIGSVFVNTNNALIRCRGSVGNMLALINPAFDGCILNAQSNVRHSGAAWFQNVNTGSSAGAIFVSMAGLYQAFSTSSWTEGQNITGAGICVESGGQFQYHASVKPTITGTISDTRIGGTIRSYAEIPLIEATNNAMMVEIKN